MLAFTPAFRVTEIEELGDVTVHYDEGVTGYTLARFPQPGDADSLYLYTFDDDGYRELSRREREDLHRWSAEQGRPLSQAALDVLAWRTWPANILFAREEMDAFAVAVWRWAEERYAALLAELAEEQRAIAAGDVGFD